MDPVGALTNNRYAFGIASTNSSFGPAVVDANGAGISGTFATGQAFPSGNGLAGSTFDFFFDVLPGDANRDGQDNATDINNIRPLSSGTRTTSASYNPYYDLLGAAIINATTLNTVRALTGRLESANPTAPSDSQGVGTTGFVGLELGARDQYISEQFADRPDRQRRGRSNIVEHGGDGDHDRQRFGGHEFDDRQPRSWSP